MPKYNVLRTTKVRSGRRREWVRGGTSVELAEKDAKDGLAAGTLVPASAAAAEPSAPPAGEEDPSKMTVDQLAAYVETIDDTEQLEALKGKVSTKGGLEAIEARIDALVSDG